LNNLHATRRYRSYDWAHTRITGGVGHGITANNLLQPYLYMNRAIPIRPVGANHNLLENHIRITINIAPGLTGAQRATALWAVLTDIINFGNVDESPIWLKVDTPGTPRYDSILLDYYLPNVAHKVARFNALCTHVTTRWGPGGTQLNGAGLNALNILGGHDWLPPFQYKGNCGFMSVSDYYDGTQRSFGTHICDRATQDGLGGNGHNMASDQTGFLDFWSITDNPFSGFWGFTDPLD